jgi:glycosyltransferase involved in cell wall biosynthesis
MLGHHLSPAKKRPFLVLARPAIDKLVIHAEAQATMARKLGFPGQSVVVLPYQVDTQFWRPPESDATVEPVISSAGLECRDYETLVAAVHGLSVRVEIGAASHWSRKRSRVSDQSAPGTVAVRSYDYPELRELYSRSRFVVAPLVETDFQAGITSILEAMAMAKAVVVSHTRGQRDVVRGPLWVGEGGDLWPAHGPSIEASNGLYVPPGDPISLRGAIKYLLNHPEVAEALGRNGRRLAETEYSLEAYVERLVAVLRAS